MIEADASKGNYELLLELLAASFPHFKLPQIEYEEKSQENGRLQYCARMKLLGQTFSSNPSATSKNEALESCSALAYEVIREFNQLILEADDTEISKCEALSSMFRPLKDEAMKVAANPTQEALRSVTEIQNRLIEVENEKIQHKVKSKSEKIIEKMQGTLQVENPEPVKISKIEPEFQLEDPRLKSSNYSKTENKNSSPSGLSLSPLNIEEKKKFTLTLPEKGTEKEGEKELNAESPVSGNVTKSSKTNNGAPIPAFYEFVDKQSSQDSIVFDDFQKGNYFGCRLRWGKKFWVAPAEHRQKRDARNYAAVMACIESFGEGFIFEAIDPRIYSTWTRESVRKSSDRYSFADSDELLAGDDSKYENKALVDSNAIKIEPLPDGRRFTSVINEICQKMRFTPPNYQVASVNSLTHYYVCTIRNFHDLPPVESLPFIKKNESKEDAAGRVYYLLKQKGVVDAANRIIGKQRIFESLEFRNKQINLPSMPEIPVRSVTSTVSAITSDGFPHPHTNENSNYSRPSAHNHNSMNLNIPPHFSHPSNSHVNSPPMPQIPMNMNMMSMLPMMSMMPMMMNQTLNSNGNSQQFDSQSMQNFEAMMAMTRQFQAFLVWQQQQQQGIQSPDTQDYASYSHSSAQSHDQIHSTDDDRYSQNYSSSHQRQRPRYERRRDHDNHISRKRNYQEDPRRN